MVADKNNNNKRNEHNSYVKDFSRSDVKDVSENLDENCKNRHDENTYVCIHCLTPSPLLYRQYSTPSSVVLVRCSDCGNDVDKYIEYEPMPGLLLIIDLVLLRIPAYRHLFLNHRPHQHHLDFMKNKQQPNNHNNCGEGPIQTHSQTFEYDKKLLFCFFATCFLDAYQKIEMNAVIIKNRENKYDDNKLVTDFPHIIKESFIHHLSFTFGVFVYSYCYISLHLLNRSFSSRLLLSAILFPTSLKFISLFMLIWENTGHPTIQTYLPQLFILLYQLISIFVVLEYLSTAKSISKIKSDQSHDSFLFSKISKFFFWGFCPVLSGLFFSYIINQLD